MLTKAAKRSLDKATLLSVKREMAEPRMARSTRNGDALVRAGKKKKLRPRTTK
jgi:hypothetical protein